MSLVLPLGFQLRWRARDHRHDADVSLRYCCSCDSVSMQAGTAVLLLVATSGVILPFRAEDTCNIT